MVFSTLIELYFFKNPYVGIFAFFFLKLTYDFCTVVFTMLNTHYSQKGKKKSALLQHFYKGWFRWRKREEECQLSVAIINYLYILVFLFIFSSSFIAQYFIFV